MLSRVLSMVSEFILTPYFGFIEGHSHLDDEQLDAIKTRVGLEDPTVVDQFECAFARLVGDGECISYAAGRMGFYDLMCQQGIGKGDEVILPGATCAVMANAVLRTGAIPIYSDIDPQTYGSSATGMAACITSSTKLIVAQHSFGIPCEIEKIKSLAVEKAIFLLEDCALTLGSKLNGVVVGNFGDAALFSTDHSKPLNTVTGGMIYTNNMQLASAMRNSRDQCGELPLKKQWALWKRLLLERTICNSRHYGKMGVIDLFYSVGAKFFGLSQPFLSDDFRSKHEKVSYPYPAKLPAFLAQVGIYEVERWTYIAEIRKKLFLDIKNQMMKSRLKKNVPRSYSDPLREIIPLRFVWHEPAGKERRYKIRKFVHVEWTWFMKPVIATREPLENLGYVAGSCPVSESVGSNMVNIPCSIKQYESVLLLEKLETLYII